ncbi:hypothetical protein M413DRAFT_445329 [Hebeloma cylindrosporum]|uniref:Uncharacterized protein n=1 Tax=Hebeloma cylindrosporum TaxID=76867 RepID=A0A0C2YJT7_HEBCY|nr:hypothetical protein M413DRAFT_445329 [Hebeloma cylindrosporum h7]
MNLINVIIFLTVPKGLRAINLTPTLMLEVILSCRLLLNLRGAYAPATGSQPRWGFGQPKWSNSTKVPTNPSQNVSNTWGPGDPIPRSTELTMFNPSTVKLDPPSVKLEPNRRVVKDENSFDLEKVNSGWTEV